MTDKLETDSFTKHEEFEANNDSQVAQSVREILQHAHRHVSDAISSDKNNYLESAVRSYSLAMDYFKTYLKMNEIGSSGGKFGTRDERAQLVAKIVQYQKRLQKLRRDLMRRKYGERSLEKSSLAEKEEETEVVVQLTASSSNGSETKRNDSDDDALHLETIIEDEELRRLVDNSDDDDSGEENGGDRSTNNNGSNSKKKTKKTAVVFDRSLSAMPRLMKKTTTTTNSRSLDGDTREGRDSGGGVFDWLLDALDALDDKIA